MALRTSLIPPRAIYEDDLQVRMDAAVARAQRFIKSTQPVRATARPERGMPFTPVCLSCQQAGHPHSSPPTSEQHYICVHCHRRWVMQPSA